MRNEEIDFSDWGTKLDTFLLLESIVITHLVHISCLLLPALFLEDQYDTEFIPQGNFQGRCETVLYKQSEIVTYWYSLLDSRLYLDELPGLPIMKKEPMRNILQTYAVLNFGVEDGSIIMPDVCMV